MEIPGIDLIEKIGQGGMSNIFKGWDHVHNRYVAVKVLNSDLSASREDVNQFKDEESFMYEIRHPGIVQAYGLECVDKLWLMIMEYVDGYSFADLLRRKQHVAEEDCLLILESVASALDYAWNDHGIVHCDIKPENILINREGVIKITDLGISHRFEFQEENGVQAEVSEHVTGTPAYISPEQIYGDVELDCRADIYSLGATLYHLATGRVLFPHEDADETIRSHCEETSQAKDPRAYRPELSLGFVQLLEAMLVKDRDGRISSWQDVYNRAQAVERGATFPARETTGVSSIKISEAPL